MQGVKNKPLSSIISASNQNKRSERDELTSLGSDDSGIMCGSESGDSLAKFIKTHNLVQSRSRTESLEDDSDIDLNIDANSDDLIVDGYSKKSELIDDTVCPEIEKVDAGEEGVVEIISKQEPPAGAGFKDFTLRLLESKLFDMSFAIHYLFKSKEPGVQMYIGNKIFSFKDQDVDFYLPQIVSMYVQMADVAEAVHPYLVHRYILMLFF